MRGVNIYFIVYLISWLMNMDCGDDNVKYLILKFWIRFEVVEIKILLYCIL